MRELSPEFMDALQDPGFLAPLLNEVKRDKDLDLQIRKDYINIYYKGNSLLRLARKGNHYAVDIHEKFREGLIVPTALEKGNIDHFLSFFPSLKDNIIRHGVSSLEKEYEQLLIRANNSELDNNSEYFILDREYTISHNGLKPHYRFDLIGFYWSRQGRKKDQELPLCLMEVKFALNSDIKHLHEQLGGYYNLIKAHGPELAREYTKMLYQKLELGLFNQPPNRLEAMKTLRFSPDISQLRFVIILVDYNPYSSQLDLEKLKGLEFANRIRIFRTGFGMWDMNPLWVDTPTPITVQPLLKVT